MVSYESTSQLREALQSMGGYEFEHFVADLWSRQGWTTEVSQKSSDRGVDITAVSNDGGFETTAVIQAKRYGAGNQVGSTEVQQYASLRRQEDADLAIIVTTSSFSRQAESLANDLNVKLVDGDGLAKLVEDLGASDLLGNDKAVSNRFVDGTNRSRSQSRRKVRSAPQDWWDVIPYMPTRDWWKAVYGFSALSVFIIPIYAYLNPASPNFEFVESVLSVVWMSIPLAIFVDSIKVHKMDAQLSQWWLFVTSAIALGPITGFIYLYYRSRSIGVP